MAYPTTLPSYTITSGTETPLSAAGGLGLSGLLNAFEADIVALGTKVGTGATSPASNTFLVGTGSGSSAWQSLTSAELASRISDETGSGSLVFGSSPTIVTPTIASFANANHDHSNGAGGGTLTHTALPTGAVVQLQYSALTAAATGTTTVPFDDTIPQNTEGDQYMSVAITPKSATNILVIEVKAWLSSSGTTDVIGSIFQDSTANALATGIFYENTSTARQMLSVNHIMVAGTTSSTTFKFRAGPPTAATITFNGGGGARLFGATTKSVMTITEYKA